MAGVKGRSGGHNRKTTSKLRAEGGYRATRHRDRADAHFAAAELPSPGELSDVGRETWERIIGSVPKGLLATIDYDALRLYCHQMQAYMTLLPVFLADPSEQSVRLSYNATVANLDKLGRQFGWTPQSRAGLKLPGKEDEAESNFSELLARMSGKN